MLENLPTTYSDPEKAPARFCIKCGKCLSFSGSIERWSCGCGHVHHDHPMPVANVALVDSKPGKNGDRVQRATKPIDPLQSALWTIVRKFNPSAGQVAFKGGFVSSFEDPEQAAIRETAEEVGLKIKLLRFLGACHPVRNTTYRFDMNSIVMTFLACIDEEGIVTAGDDALDANAYTQDQFPELCFTSHNYVAQRWFKSDYEWSDGIPVSTKKHVDRNKDEEVAHCIKCAAPLSWNDDDHVKRYQCDDRVSCKWTHWNSPTPYARAVLVNGSDELLLRKAGDLWVLPNDPIPAYHTTREAIEIAMQKRGVPIRVAHNLGTRKVDDDNRVDVLYKGDFNSLAPTPPEHRLLKIGELPDDLWQVDQEIVRQYQEGYFEKFGTAR